MRVFWGDETNVRCVGVPGQLSVQGSRFQIGLARTFGKNLASRRLAHVQAGRFTEIFSPELPRFRWRGRLLSLYICA